MTLKIDGKTAPTLTQFFILWASLLASQSMIVLVAQTAITHPVITSGSEAPASAFAAQGVPLEVFGVIAAVFAAAAYFVPRLMLRELAASFRAQPNSLSNVELKDLTEKVLPAWIVRWVLLEAVTLVGFTASILYALPTAIYPFAAVSLVAFALTFPSEEKIRSQLLRV